MTRRGGDEFLRGTISAVGAPTGDRFVVGAWRRSPIGPFADVMWARPDDTRVLLASSEEARAYVAGIYDFEETRVVDLRWEATPTTLRAAGGDLEVDLVAGGGARVPVRRPWWFTRWVEGPIARAVMGVETHGHSPHGVEEWYQARAWRWVRRADLRLAGEPLGEFEAPRPPLRVGFSEPPPRASITDVAVRLRR